MQTILFNFCGYILTSWWLDVIYAPIPLTHLPLDKMATTLADDHFQCIFYEHDSFFILLRISLKVVPRSLINNNLALVQVMAWHQTGDKPFSEPVLTQLTDVYMQQ